MGGALAKVAIPQAAKQAAGEVTKKLTRQTVKRLAVRGAKELGKVLL